MKKTRGPVFLRFVVPIELVDGEKLVGMFERVPLGLKPVQTFEVDDAFFEEFRK